MILCFYMTLLDDLFIVLEHNLYDDLFKQSNLPTLQTGRQNAKLCHLFKIINEAMPFFLKLPPKRDNSPTPVALCTLMHSSHYQLTRHSSTTLFSQLPLLRATHYLLMQSLLHHCLHLNLPSRNCNNIIASMNYYPLP